MRITIGLVCVVMLCGMMIGCAKQEKKVESPPAAEEMMPAAQDAAKEATAVVGDTTKAVADDTRVKQAQATLTKVLDAIKKGDMATAEKELKALEGMQDLSADMQKQIKDARTSLDAATAAEKMKTDVTKSLPKL